MTTATDDCVERDTGTAARDGVDCAGFLAALERLFAIGVLYPPGHASCLEVTRGLLVEIRRLRAGAPVLNIDAGRDALGIQGRLVPLHDRPAARLHEILKTIGVFRVEIDEAAAPADLHALAGQLLRAKHEADTALGFRQLDFGSLPATVRVQAREFGRRLGGAEGFALRSDQIRDAASRALQEIEGRGLDDRTRETLRSLTEQFLQGIAERLEMQAPTAEGSRPAFVRSLDEVLDVGIRAVRHALTRVLPGGGEIGELQRLFESAEMALALSPDAQGVELMVDILSESASERDAAAPAPPPAGREVADDQGCALSLTELRSRLEAEAAAEPLAPWDPQDRAEQISVLCQLLLGAPGPEALAGAGRRLGQCLSSAPRPRELEILAGALAALLGAAGTRVVDGALPFILKPLRRTAALGSLLTAACRGASPDTLRAAWPHVVNELLLGLEEANAPAERELRRVAASLSEEEMRRAMPRLEALEAVRERVCSRQLFRSPDLELWPLYALLLGSPLADLMGPSLLEAARGLPSAWPGAPALSFLTDYAPRQRPFLIRVLREVGRGAASPELLEVSGRIVVEGLRGLPADRRLEPWVPGAIRALAILPVPDAAKLLAEIVHRRRFLVLRLWPAACRDSAAHALRLRRSVDALADSATCPVAGGR